MRDPREPPTSRDGATAPLLDARARRDRTVLTVARTARGLGAGVLSVDLALELAHAGYSPWQVGLALGLAMGAAAAWAIALPTGARGVRSRAARLATAAGALALGGFLLWTDLASPVVVLLALALGGVVAGGSDISPLGALEQGAIAEALPDRARTSTFAAYNLAGYLGSAAGAILATGLAGVDGSFGLLPPGPRDAGFLLYGAIGLALIPTYAALSPESGAASAGPTRSGLSAKSRGPILRLSALFAVDAVGGGMIANALVAYFLLLRFHAPLETIGIVIGVANVAAAASLLLAVPLARRIGLIPTMVFTHLPSSALLIAFAAAPTLAVAAGLWIARAMLSQMDVPTRQSYTQAIVPRSEGAAAAGYTTAARSAQAVGGPITGALFAAGGVWLPVPFALAGGVKIAYDLAIYRSFRGLRPPEESEPSGAPSSSGPVRTGGDPAGAGAPGGPGPPEGPRRAG